MKPTKVRPCDEWAESLAAHHPNDLPPDVRAALNAHLRECEACQTVYASYQQVARLVGQVPDFSLPAGLPPKLLEEWEQSGKDDTPIKMPLKSTYPLPARQRRKPSEDILHLVIEIGPGTQGEYPVTLRSGGDSAHRVFKMPAAGVSGMPPLPDWTWLAAQEPEHIQLFGQRLFEALFSRSISPHYVESLEEAARQKVPLRLSLSLQAPELERVPWEVMYDPHLATYLSLAPDLQLARIVDAPAQPARPLARMRPLRILGINTSWSSRQGDGEPRPRSQHQQAPKAFTALQEYGFIEWQEIMPISWQEALEYAQAGSWHSVHIAAQVSSDGETEDASLDLGGTGDPLQPIKASHIAHTLAGLSSLQVVVLTPSAAPSIDQSDGFAKAAKTLVRQGIPAVLSIPTRLNEQAADLFTQFFYEAQAQGRSAAGATARARRGSARATVSSPAGAAVALYLSALGA